MACSVFDLKPPVSNASLNLFLISRFPSQVSASMPGCISHPACAVQRRSI